MQELANSPVESHAVPTFEKPFIDSCQPDAIGVATDRGLVPGEVSRGAQALLLARSELFEYHDWCEGGLVRQPRRLS